MKGNKVKKKAKLVLSLRCVGLKHLSVKFQYAMHRFFYKKLHISERLLLFLHPDNQTIHSQYDESNYAEFFSEPYPARPAVAVKIQAKGALVEIEVIAEAK